MVARGGGVANEAHSQRSLVSGIRESIFCVYRRHPSDFFLPNSVEESSFIYDELNAAFAGGLDK